MRKTVFALAGALAVTVACGKATPVTSIPPVPAEPAGSPSPAPAPSPTPVPSPTPCAADCPEEPVTNTNPAARVSIRLYVVEDPGGGYISNPNPDDIPVGYVARVDVTSKDADNRETEGRGPVEFFFNNPNGIKVWGNHTNQRRVQALGPGQVDCWATQDGVRSNILTLTFH